MQTSSIGSVGRRKSRGKDGGIVLEDKENGCTSLFDGRRFFCLNESVG